MPMSRLKPQHFLVVTWMLFSCCWLLVVGCGCGCRRRRHHRRRITFNSRALSEDDRLSMIFIDDDDGDNSDDGAISCDKSRVYKHLLLFWLGIKDTSLKWGLSSSFQRDHYYTSNWEITNMSSKNHTQEPSLTVLLISSHSEWFQPSCSEVDHRF